MRMRLPALLAAALIGSCALAQTPGERFRKTMEERKRYCTANEMRPGETTCDILKLGSPDPLATREGRFAHSIKLPAAADSGRASYRAGMSSEEYFKDLCQREAGGFILRTVDGVDGVMRMRPRPLATHYMKQHLYAHEDPYGYRDWEARTPATRLVGPGSYQFHEVAIAGEGEGRVIRYSGYDGRNSRTLNSEQAASPRSRYGFTWRGVTRPNDRELGIAGGELIVLDIQTGEVLAVKRGFVRTGDVQGVPPGIWWPTAAVCPREEGSALFMLPNFVTQILRPKRVEGQS